MKRLLIRRKRAIHLAWKLELYLGITAVQKPRVVALVEVDDRWPIIVSYHIGICK